MSIPKVIFGKCPVCGGGGGDDPNASGADVPATLTEGNGIPLVYYQGELMCEICKQTKINEEESLRVAEKHSDAEDFRAQAGFTNTVS